MGSGSPLCRVWFSPVTGLQGPESVFSALGEACCAVDCVVLPGAGLTRYKVLLGLGARRPAVLLCGPVERRRGAAAHAQMSRQLRLVALFPLGGDGGKCGGRARGRRFPQRPVALSPSRLGGGALSVCHYLTSRLSGVTATYGPKCGRLDRQSNRRWALAGN